MERSIIIAAVICLQVRSRTSVACLMLSEISVKLLMKSTMSSKRRIRLSLSGVIVRIAPLFRMMSDDEC